MLNIASLDLNLLRVLSALLETRSITLTGARLGLSQPAASRAVARLRQALGDPLLVRSSSGYVLTPHAEALKPRVAMALKALEEVLAPAAFEAATTRRVFRLAMTDYGSLAVMACVVPRFMAMAPGARLDIRPWTTDTLVQLESGELDLALYADGSLPPHFHSRDLFQETYAAIVRHAHPLVHALAGAAVLTARTGRSGAPARRQAPLAWEAFVGYPHALMTFPDGRNISVDDPFSKMGFPPQQVPLLLPYFTAAPWIVAASNLVMTLPRRLAERLAQVARLEVLPLPADFSAFPYRMVWHERGHREPALRWLRSFILKVVSERSSDRPEEEPE